MTANAAQNLEIEFLNILQKDTLSSTAGCKKMKVIPFPGTCKAEPTLPKTDSYKLHQGPVHFTCPHCKHTQEAVFNGMLFRSVEFHCGHCGQLFKVSNPALSSTTKKHK